MRPSQAMLYENNALKSKNCVTFTIHTIKFGRNHRHRGTVHLFDTCVKVNIFFITIESPSIQPSIKHTECLAIGTVNTRPVRSSNMNLYTVVLAFALAAVAVAEPPSGYNYNRPGGNGGFSHGGGYSLGGGSYSSEPIGYQTSEGASVDPQLLEQVRQILLNEEQNHASASSSSSISSFHGAPSPQYGVPSSSYGAPGGYSARVVGIDLEGIKQAMQVAQFHQQTQEAGHGFSGYSSGPASSPSSSYGAPY
ncbi:unnamed protein product [Brassicogethes aeneus]|uniref:Uncharacterized protein n=1 Tax=Brassicogethes aeneus TaxID=1431903 RepID=A0A9P0B8D7_BRAAE|nr:unnamed protein product [Brassicogethes aeneus]